MTGFITVNSPIKSVLSWKLAVSQGLNNQKERSGSDGFGGSENLVNNQNWESVVMNKIKYPANTGIYKLYYTRYNSVCMEEINKSRCRVKRGLIILANFSIVLLMVEHLLNPTILRIPIVSFLKPSTLCWWYYKTPNLQIWERLRDGYRSRCHYDN